MSPMYRFVKAGECKDATLGACSLKEINIIAIYALPLEQCQITCHLFGSCVTFHWNETSCVLLKNDYQLECKNTAAPFVSFM